MIHCFPTPKPDELLYSICARLQSRLPFPSWKSFVFSLFERESALAVIDLPGSLGQLTRSAGLESVLPAVKIVENHTLLPFYAPFVAPKRLELIQEDMINDGGRAAYCRAGLMAGRVRPPTHLRFCPKCAAEDIDRYCFTYWHRIHQITGVEVCANHEVFLEESSVNRVNRRTRHSFIDADKVVKPCPSRPLNEENREHQTLLNIARNAAWILSKPMYSLSGFALRERYIRLLADRQLATYSGRVRRNDLYERFGSRYSPDLLHALQCDLSREWLGEVFRGGETAQNPIRHLLVMDFLGCGAEMFFSDSQAAVFEKPPYPCLNRVCRDYRRPIIGSCSVELHHPGQHAPVGSFVCPTCDFCYCRVGPDLDSSTRETPAWVKDYGEMWMSALRRYWNDERLSLREIARKLDVDTTTVKRHAYKLQLKFPRIGPRITSVGSVIYHRKPESRKSPEHSDRQAWMNLCSEHPSWGTKALRESDPALYARLRRHSADWLTRHTPASQRPNPAGVRANWAQRDCNIVTRLADAAANIRDRPGKPIKITISSLGIALGVSAYLSKHLDKLPLTRAAISQLVESRESFAIRRIRLAAEAYRDDRIYPALWQLTRRAGIRPDLTEIPNIRAALNAALLHLRTGT